MAQFTLSDPAAERIGQLLAADPAHDALRVAVLAGGCNGFQYKFELAAGREPDDLLIARGGATVVVDPASLDLLEGAELHYVDELMGAYFTVRNPNAKSSCGCGVSFSVD